MDIPILGNLFLQRNDSKQREELIVLMRPTVLPTPALAAKNTYAEEQRLPGVARSESEDAEENRKLIEVERKREVQEYKSNHDNPGFYTPQPDEITTNQPLDLPVPQSSIAPGNQPSTDVEEVTPVAPAVHPQADAVPPTDTVPPAAPATPDSTAAPVDSNEMQQKAAAALSQKMMELDSTNGAH
jgi:hypothetical protein